MRLSSVQPRLLAIVLVGIFTAGAGCTPHQSAPPAAPAPARPPASLSQIRSELLDARAQLDTTAKTLHALAGSSANNVRANDDALGAEYYKLVSKTNVVRSRAYDLKSTASLHDSTIPDDMEAARFAFNRYMSNLQQIREFLGATPTVAKLEAMTDLLSTSQAQSRELQGRLDALVRSIDALAATTREAYIDQPATQQ